MKDLTANLRLRPTRIAFLVSPSDEKSVREIMRINACLWGGMYNPMIPVFRNSPKAWLKDKIPQLTGRDVAEGYIKFFEPDVYVEAKVGLLEKSGLGSFRKNHFESPVISLEHFFETEYQGVQVPAFGQSVLDIIDHAYESERRFVLRDESPAICSQSPSTIFSEICIGAFPENDKTDYVRTAYQDVFKPTLAVSNPETWLKVFGGKFVTPFTVSNRHIDIKRPRRNDPVIYIFDPRKTTDLLDLWNLRIEPSQVFPVPQDWFAELVGPLRKFIEANFRPLRGNNNGVMHSTTVEVARSISEEQAQDQFLPSLQGLPPRSWALKMWRTRVWNVDYSSKGVMHPERIVLTTSAKTKTVFLKDEGFLHTEFDSMFPEFARTYSGSRNRWANVLSLKSWKDCNVALSLPYNTFDKEWPFSSGLSQFGIGREGWVFNQDYKDSTQTVQLLRHDAAFTSWFKSKGIQVSLSDAGRIAKQMLESLGGFWGLYLFDDEASIRLVNRLANSSRIRIKTGIDETLEEEFSGRVASIEQWQAMIKERQSRGAHQRVDLSSYIAKNVIKVGLESKCSRCNKSNWHDLDEVSYKIKCNRCLKKYDFPQGELRQNNRNWKYRVIGPFAVPDYAQGAYASLLTIRFFTYFNTLARDKTSTYSTAMDVASNEKIYEIDFAIWASDEPWGDEHGEPRLIVGEAKSFADNAITEKELSKLKGVAELMPNSILVVSVLKTEFSEAEINLLKEFVEWTREPVNYSPRHWVILLTGTELYNPRLSQVWERKGEPFSNFSDYHSTSNFESLSDATLAIYLGIPNYYSWLDEQ